MVNSQKTNVLAYIADVGGTNARFALYDFQSNSIIKNLSYYCSEFLTFEAVINQFYLDTIEQQPNFPDVMAFAIAAPIVEGKCKATNLSWEIDSQRIVETFKIKNCFLINDLEANAYGINTLDQSKIISICEPKEQYSGNRAIISSGTGLGEAGLFWNGSQYIPIASEGGHTEFSVQSEEDYRLFMYLRSLYDHVSWERVLSGMGIVNLYNFFCIEMNVIPIFKEAKYITQAGIAKNCPVSQKVLQKFAYYLGVEAGNLSLKWLARGGLYIGGGIAPQIVAALMDGNFLDGFLAKGRMKDVLQSVPIRLIIESNAALQGVGWFLKKKLTDRLFS